MGLESDSDSDSIFNYFSILLLSLKLERYCINPILFQHNVVERMNQAYEAPNEAQLEDQEQ